MDVITCISGRRSVRSYTAQTIPAETMDQLIRLGTMAATGSNQQSWGFVVLQDKEEIDQLSEQIKEQLLEHLDRYPHLAQYEAGLKNPKFHIFNGACNLLILYGNTASYYYREDGALAAANIMLAAHAMGLGSCWIGFAEFALNTPAFKAAHNVPEDYALVCPLVLGYPAKTLEPPVRKTPTVFYRG